MYTIKFPKAVLEHLELNGNNYISKTLIDEEIFKDLSKVIIVDEDTKFEEPHEEMKLIHYTKYGEEYWFALEDKSEPEKLTDKIRNAIQANSSDLTDVQIALAEIYEYIIGGM